MAFLLPLANTVGVATNGTGRLFVNASGNVGINTTDPFYTLDVQGGSQRIINQGNVSFLEIGTGTTTNQSAFIDFVGDTTYTDFGLRIVRGNTGANSTSVITTERLRIDTSGRLLVGTSSDSGGALFQVNGDRIRIGTAKTPASASATGATGEIAWDANYIYVAVASNTWKRAALSTW
jgi:hypothetical protein